MNGPVDREELATMMALLEALELREQRELHSKRSYYDDDGVMQGGLMSFVRYFWEILEPDTPLVEGWALYAIVEHLEGVAFGDMTRLLINVSPGFAKSLMSNVFFPAWVWGPLNRPGTRFLTFSYSSSLTERDNEKFRDLCISQKYQALYGEAVQLTKIGSTLVGNKHTGWKRASSVGGVTTGMRADIVLCDDLHSVKEAESETVRSETTRWFRESLTNRLNNMEKSSIVVIMQRVHSADVAGVIIDEGMEYEHLIIPNEYEWGRHCSTSIGWEDPRGFDDDGYLLVVRDADGRVFARDDAALRQLDQKNGELAWPERFPEHIVDRLKRDLGPYAYAGQYQQSPNPRDGGLFKRDWWQTWESPEFPQFEFLLGSVDTAFTEKEMNDPTAMTVWGVFYQGDQPNVMLVDSWAKRLQMHGSLPLQAFHEKNVRGAPNQEYLARCEALLPREPAERDRQYYERIKGQWGVVEWIAHTARLRRVHRVLIENKTGGITAAQELGRIHGREGFTIDLVTPRGDKVARAMAVQPLFPQGLIWAPDRTYADRVMDEMEVFPKGRHDDLTDTATMALKWLRDNGFANRVEETDAIENERRQLRKKAGPLYGLR